MIGGEGPANPIWMSHGAWIDYAQEHNAICFQLEHRFYGESHPTKDLSVKNLVYLTSTQGMYFICKKYLTQRLTRKVPPRGYQILNFKFSVIG